MVERRKAIPRRRYAASFMMAGMRGWKQRGRVENTEV
jgi:hypothetical protein